MGGWCVVLLALTLTLTLTHSHSALGSSLTSFAFGCAVGTHSLKWSLVRSFVRLFVRCSLVCLFVRSFVCWMFIRLVGRSVVCFVRCRVGVSVCCFFACSLWLVTFAVVVGRWYSCLLCGRVTQRPTLSEVAFAVPQLLTIESSGHPLQVRSALSRP